MQLPAISMEKAILCFLSMAFSRKNGACMFPEWETLIKWCFISSPDGGALSLFKVLTLRVCRGKVLIAIKLAKNLIMHPKQLITQM